MSNSQTDTEAAPAKRFDTLHVVLFTLLAVIITALLAVWLFRTYLFPKEFKPVALSQQEEQVLDRKLEWLGLPAQRGSSKKSNAVKPLEPERYSEAGAKREVTFSEREVNALLAKNTDLADKLAIDLSEDMVSARLLVPLDEDFPIMGGKTLKVKAGLGLAYRDEKPVVILKGVSVMGVPVPNAWLGNLKNIDLIEQYGGQSGFWKSFAEGVDQLVVEEGELKIKLKE